MVQLNNFRSERAFTPPPTFSTTAMVVATVREQARPANLVRGALFIAASTPVIMAGQWLSSQIPGVGAALLPVVFIAAYAAGVAATAVVPSRF